MDNTPSISVVLPNFNHGRSVGMALQALLAQSTAPREIIVVDDASTDDGPAVVRQIAVAHPCIRLVVIATNQGVIRALKRGLEFASGDYIYLAAADDWTMP